LMKFLIVLKILIENTFSSFSFSDNDNDNFLFLCHHNSDE
jgi:hypothetical protein